MYTRGSRAKPVWNFHPRVFLRSNAALARARAYRERNYKCNALLRNQVPELVSSAGGRARGQEVNRRRWSKKRWCYIVVAGIHTHRPPYARAETMLPLDVQRERNHRAAPARVSKAQEGVRTRGESSTCVCVLLTWTRTYLYIHIPHREHHTRIYLGTKCASARTFSQSVTHTIHAYNTYTYDWLWFWHRRVFFLFVDRPFAWFWGHAKRASLYTQAYVRHG